MDSVPLRPRINIFHLRCVQFRGRPFGRVAIDLLMGKCIGSPWIQGYLFVHQRLGLKAESLWVSLIPGNPSFPRTISTASHLRCEIY